MWFIILFLLSGQNNWLQLDRKVLDHDFSKTSGPLELKFLVRWVAKPATCWIHIHKPILLKISLDLLFYMSCEWWKKDLLCKSFIVSKACHSQQVAVMGHSFGPVVWLPHCISIHIVTGKMHWCELCLQTLHRFYIEKITFLKENTTVELFFLNAKSLVFNVSVFRLFFNDSLSHSPFCISMLNLACPSVLDYCTQLLPHEKMLNPTIDQLQHLLIQ